MIKLVQLYLIVYAYIYHLIRGLIVKRTPHSRTMREDGHQRQCEVRCFIQFPSCFAFLYASLSSKVAGNCKAGNPFS